MNLILSLVLLVFVSIQPTLAVTPIAPIDRAKATYKSGKYTEAASQLEAILKTNPNDDQAHYYLALSYHALNQKSKEQWHMEWVKKNSKDRLLLLGANQALGAKASAAASAAKKTETVAAQPTIYDFGAAWCVPCKKFAPIFDRISEKYKGKINFVHIDVDDAKQKQIVDQYKISIVPTLVFADAAGKTVFTHQGVFTDTELVQKADELIK